MAGVHLKFNDCVETLGRHEEEDFDEETALEDLKRALHLDLIDISSIPVQQIQSRAKSSHIVKALVCFQAAWLVAQVLGRGIERLPITSLETVTVGYVFCALVTYSCWWHKAQDAEIPITIDCGNITKEEFCRQIRTVPADTKLFEWWEIISTCLILTTFGAIHCVAWSFYFVTSAEAVIWKVACVLTVALPVGVRFLLGYERCILHRHHHDDFKSVELSIGINMILVYSAIRLYLIVEPFAAFRSVPVGIFYAVNWANWIPHI
jgi:hypothetical protein